MLATTVGASNVYTLLPHFVFGGEKDEGCKSGSEFSAAELFSAFSV
jgi:hypothetical protein